MGERCYENWNATTIIGHHEFREGHVSQVSHFVLLV